MGLPDAIIRAVASGAVDESSVALEELGSSQSKVYYADLLEMFSSRESDNGIRIVIADGTMEAVLGYLWSLRISRATLVLSSEASEKDVAALCQRFGVSSVISGPMTIGELSLPEEISRVRGANRWFHFREIFQPRELVAGVRATLLATSGSTGQPKFVRLSNEGVLQNARDIQQVLNMVETDVAAGVLPLSYSYGLSVLHSSLIAGGKFIFGAPLQPMSREFRGVLLGEGVTHLPGVPFTHDIYERLGVYAEPSRFLRCVTQAGGRLHPEKVANIHDRLSAFGIRFHPMYGQTEASARIAIMPHELVREFPDYVGRVVPSGRLTFLSDNHEIIFEGPNVMLGYADSFEALEAPDTVGGRLHTGDKGELGPHGLLRITGRLKRIAKINGTRVDLDSLSAHFDSTEVIMTEATGQILVCLTSPSTAIRSKVLNRAHEFGLQARDLLFVHIEKIPMLPNGKPDYRRLGELL